MIVGHTMRFLALVLTLAVSAIADQRSDFFERLEADAVTRVTLERAFEDFDRVVAYKKPVHATQSRPDTMLFDGGTTFWKGEGYRIEIRKTICGIGPKRGFFMYGPILIFDEAIVRGDEEGRTISNVRLFSGTQLHKRLSEEEPNKQPQQQRP